MRAILFGKEIENDFAGVDLVFSEGVNEVVREFISIHTVRLLVNSMRLEMYLLCFEIRIALRFKGLLAYFVDMCF